jgi:hypothetical protein
MWLYTRLTTSVPLDHLSRDQLAYPVFIQANPLSMGAVAVPTSPATQS